MEVGPRCTEPPASFEPPTEDEYRGLVPRLIDLLRDPDAAVRRSSASTLGRLGDLAAPAAVPGLVDLLVDADGEVRGAAVGALARLREVDGLGVERLLALLRVEDVSRREDVTWALGAFAAHRAAIAPRLWQVVEADPAPRVRFAAICSLLELDEARPRCVEALVTGVLEGRDSELRSSALYVLRELGAAAAPALPAIVAALDDGDPQVRARACEALGELPGDAADVVTGLLARIDDEEPDVSYAASEALVARQAAEAVPVFARRLAGADTRDEALDVLARLGAPALPALQAALELEAPNDDDLAMIVDALGELGEVAAPAVTRLIELAAHESPLVRERAVLALGRIGVVDEAVLAALVARLGDPEPGVRCFAARALGALRATASVADLVRALGDDDAEVRVVAAAALEALGPAASPSVEALRAALAIEDADLRRAAALALSALGPAAADARDDLVGLSASDDPCVRHAALYASAGLDGDMDAALRTLEADLEADDAEVRNSAAEVLGRAGARAQGAVPRLLELLRRRDWRDRRVDAALARIGGDPELLVPVLLDAVDLPEVADALGAMGAAARSAIPALEAAARHDDGDTRFGARRALRRLRAAE